MTREQIDKELERLAEQWGVVLYAVFPDSYPRVTAAFPATLATLEQELVPPHRRGHEPSEVTP